jgi:hypothetical protein
MNSALLAIVTAIYFGVAVSFLLEGKAPWALVFLAYAAANVGLIWASL